MPDTSPSLLCRLKQADDASAWGRLVDLYSPLIRGWLIRRGLSAQDTDDVVQEVLTRVVRKIGEFERKPQTGAFRSWLRTITVFCLREHWRACNRSPRGAGDTGFQQMLEQLEDPQSGLSRQWDEEYDKHITKKLLEMIRPSFTEKTWAAFEKTALQGKSADEAASELEMTTNAVFIAKSRVISRLRHEGEGILEEE